MKHLLFIPQGVITICLIIVIFSAALGHPEPKYRVGQDVLVKGTLKGTVVDHIVGTKGLIEHQIKYQVAVSPGVSVIYPESDLEEYIKTPVSPKKALLLSLAKDVQ
jgi:hypothetical protein